MCDWWTFSSSRVKSVSNHRKCAALCVLNAPSHIHKDELFNEWHTWQRPSLSNNSQVVTGSAVWGLSFCCKFLKNVPQINQLSSPTVYMIATKHQSPAANLLCLRHRDHLGVKSPAKSNSRLNWSIVWCFLFQMKRQ